MNKILKKLISGLLAVIMIVGLLPAQALAAAADGSEKGYVTELDDGYISISVSKQNGGFLIDTLLGNQLKDGDDNKNLLFPSEGYDSSFTSIQVTRTDGSMEEYIFGRQYGFMGLSSTDVTVEKAGSSIIATWGVKDLTVVQTLTLLDETNPQHGLVDIGYDVSTSSDDVADVKVRIMLDSALGSQDYGFYQLYDGSDSFNLVKNESVVENAYENILMTVAGEGPSAVTAYTVNALLDGVEQKPYQVAFGHWANLANTVFDFVPDLTRPPFHIPNDAQYLTADSAYALYYDLGPIGKDESVNISSYYGLYSNATVTQGDKAAINFLQLPSTMEIKDGSTTDAAAYRSQVTGGNDGDVEVKMLIENVSNVDVGDMTVVVKTMNNVSTYTGNYPKDQSKVNGNHRVTVNHVSAGEEVALNLYFNLTPMQLSEYRYFEIEVYSGTEVTEGRLMGSKGFYVLCPSVLGEEVSFNTTNPQTIYTEGTRTLYVSGENFRLLEDTSAYTAYLKPMGVQSKNGTRSNLPAGSIIPGKNIIINDDANTMNLVVDSTLAPGTYQLVMDWNEEGKPDTTSVMLIVNVSDDEAYMTPSFGMVTIEKSLDYTDDNPTYEMNAYSTEEIYKQYWEKKSKENKQWNANEMVLLEFRGNFSLKCDEQGNLVEATATSIENADGSVSGTINISNCLDVEVGYVTISVENYGAENQCINTDIDGHVYISGERTTVWDGVCAITSIEDGEINDLRQYRHDGSEDNTVEGTTKIANTISLLWPAAAGTAQQICGIFFEMRYCEFGQITTDSSLDPNLPIPTDAEKIRVIAFSAYMDPSCLLPTDYNWQGRETSTIDAVQLTLARSHYTPGQLREYDAKYKDDMSKWMAAQEGTLTLIVENILFGASRFIGFAAEMNVGLPSYFEGIGGIEGTLHLEVWLLDPAEEIYFEFGVNGAIDLSIVSVEATLVLKSINGIPIPDELYIYVGGFSPGWNIDCHGILWLNGLGGGFSKLYESIVSKSKVPAFTVSLEGGFSLFQILYARIKLSLSARGIAFDVKNLGFNKDTSNNIYGSSTDDILTLIPWMGASIYWYPKLKISAGINVSVLSIVEGGGFLVLEENTETGKMFFEAGASCTVRTPKIPLIGSVTLGGVDVGVDLSRIYGVLHILKLDMGLTYYYGKEVDFSIGKYEVPGPTLCSMSLGKTTGGTPVYLAFGTNITEVANSQGGIVLLSNKVPAPNSKPAIVGASDRMHYTLALGNYTAGDVALTVTYPAASAAEARTIAKGGWFNDGIRLTNSSGEEYELTWLDATGELDEEAADSANALLNYDEQTGKATVTISFTDETDFTDIWNLECSTACDVVMYSIGRLADVERVEYTTGNNNSNMTVTCYGTKLNELDELSISAIDQDGLLYQLHAPESLAVSEDGSRIDVTFDIPEYLSTGDYQIQVTAKDTESSVNDIEEAADRWNYVNPKQPLAPTINRAGLGGDYTIDVAVTANGSVAYDGYVATIEQYNEETKTWELTEFADSYFEADQTLLTVGGSYSSTVWTDEEGNELTYAQYQALTEEEKAKVATSTREVGLVAGTKYRVAVSAYTVTESGNTLSSKVKYTDTITMVAPNPATVTVTGVDAKQILEANGFNEITTVDVYTNNTVKLNLTADMDATVTWTLDDGVQEGTADLKKGQAGTVTLTGVAKERDLVGDQGLAEGNHTLKIHITNAQGDESTAAYTFRVDTVAPKIMLTGPDTGSFYGETVTVSGVSEADAQVQVQLNGKTYTAETDYDGSFSVDIPMDTTVYEQTLVVCATDAAGNASRNYDLVLTNELVGNRDAELAIYLNGKDISGQTVPAGTDGELELRYVIKHSDGSVTSVTVPHNSSQGSRVYWDVYAVNGSGSVSREGGFKLETSNDINGMLTVTVDKLQVAAVLGGNVTALSEQYLVTLPTGAGYTVETTDAALVPYGGSFSFTVKVANGFYSGDMKVFANGKELIPISGVYTIENIHSDKTVTVTGVVPSAAPQVSITVADSTWREFLNNITFGLLFKETQTVTVAASDDVIGLDKVYYYISNEALSEEEVKALGSDVWTPYTDSFTIDPNNTYVIYAKAVNYATVVTYVSSDGIVLKNTKPVITGVKDGGIYYGDTTVSVSDEYLATVTLDGEEVTLDQGSFIIPADNAEHTVTAADAMGNEITVTVTVYQTYTVTFLADGETVATMQLPYGESLSGDEFPEIPHKPGYDRTAPVWNTESIDKVTADVTVEAVYTQNIYTVSLPQNPVGYQVKADTDKVAHGDSFRFTVETDEGYNAEELLVTVNGAKITPVDGVYTVEAVEDDLVIEVGGIVDTAAPEAAITVAENSWREFLNTITFGLFFNKTQDVTVTATDAGSGIGKVLYHVSDRQLTVSDLGNVAWNTYDGTFHIDADGQYVIYAKVTDKAGNMTLISTDGIVLDGTVPKIEGITDGGTYYGSQIAKVSDDNISTIVVNGETVYDAADGEIITEKAITFLPSNGKQTLTVTDKAGNTVSAEISVYEIYTVTFMADGKLVAEISVNHGDSLSTDAFPAIPHKAGYDRTAPVWNPESMDKVTADMTVEAVYTKNIYTVNLPQNPVGYQVKADTDKVTHGDSFRFTVETDEGYNAEELVVKVNGTEITPADGVYTVEAVEDDLVIEVTGIVDTAVPEASITVAENTWHEFLNTVTFGLFFKQTQDVTITATDVGSGIGKILYHVSDRQLTVSDLENVAWNTYDGAFHIDADGQYVIYAKVTDKAGNMTLISTDGMVIDTAAPQVSGIKDGGVYYGAVTFTVSDDSIAQITVNGKSVSGEKITLQPAKGAQEIVIIDKAGNRVVMTVTVNEVAPTQPQPEKPGDDPTTGDDNIVWICSVLMILAMAACCWLLISNRKKETA